jgi:bifunctional non-homologous end joining protein LigD
MEFAVNLRFVVHEHHASRLHYDFRLEWEGVLQSWAIPKGPSMNPAEKRLAVSVEDHSVDYFDFEGIIPRGQYGAGAVLVWDTGTYEPVERRGDSISFVLYGQKLRGGFTLTLLKGKGTGKEWLLIKKKDEYADAAWKTEPSLTPEKESELQERIPPCAAS